MRHYAGLDVSMKTTFICIVNEQGEIAKQAEVATNPEDIGAFLAETRWNIAKIGLESGCLTHYLKKGLMGLGFDVVGMESHKMSAILATIINKTDKNDARGIAEALRVGHYKTCVHRSEDAIERRTILHGRKTAVECRTQVITSIKGHLKVYGIRLGAESGKHFAEKVERAIAPLRATVRRIIHGLLNILSTIEVEIKEFNQLIKDIGRQDEQVQLLQTVDGVGDITAAAFVAEIDEPERFKSSKDVAAYIGLTPTQYASGATKRQGGISKKGSKHTRSLLVEAATSLLMRCRAWSKLKAWGLKLMKKIGKKKAIIAVARKLAVVMHRMLITKQPFERGTKKQKELAAA